MEPISITAVGVATPLGIGVESLWKALVSKDPLPKRYEIDMGDPSFESLSPRLKRKMDRFTTIAYPPFEEMIQQLGAKSEELQEKGIILGNSTGGWSYVEPQMDALYNESFHTLNPYVATAWFPTAIQGQISISFGIGGYSKTIAADNLSAAYCLIHTLDLLNAKDLHSCFIGGVESPTNPLVYRDTKDRGNDEVPLSEGAALLHLERGKRGLATIEKVCEGSSCKETVETLLKDCGLCGDEIDVVLIDGWEMDMIRELGMTGNVGVTKELFGNSIACDYALKLVLGALILDKKSFPESLSKEKVEKSPLPKEPKRVLVGGGDLHGQYVTTLLTA